MSDITSNSVTVGEHNMRDHLWHIVMSNGGMRCASISLGISQSYLCDVMHGRRPVSARLAKALGYTRKVVFSKDEDLPEPDTRSDRPDPVMTDEEYADFKAFMESRRSAKS